VGGKSTKRNFSAKKEKEIVDVLHEAGEFGGKGRVNRRGTTTRIIWDARSKPMPRAFWPWRKKKRKKKKKLTKLLAICVRCAAIRRGPIRNGLVESEELIVVGASGMYEGALPAMF